MNLNKKFFLRRILKFSFIFIFIVFLTKSLFEESVEKKEEKKEKTFINYSNDIKIFDSNDENTFYNKYRRVKDHRIDSCKIIENNQRNSSFIDKSVYVVFEYRNNYCNKNNILNNCRFKNCIFTCNKSLIKEADALLFHESDLVNENDIYKLLKNRNINQIWTINNDEPRMLNSKHDYIKFNWTMSYYSNADVSYCTFGCLEFKHKTITEEEFDNLAMIEFKKRQNTGLWFVSNCFNKLRLKYGGELANYFPLNIIGECESYIKKYIHHSKEIFQECKRSTDCEIDLQMSHKFYLAFESSNCTDYITEKFWRSLSFGLIPIVIQPEKKYYELVAPRESFIHAEDFDYDMKKLGNYLLKISSNFSLYLKYVKWKFEYAVLYKNIGKYRVCEFCAKLNNERSTIYYDTVASWFNKKCSN
jgi:hypothetical protein